MKQQAFTTTAASAVLALATAIASPPPTTGSSAPTLRAGSGWVIFDPSKDGFAYRYDPSIIINDNGSIDDWFASPGGNGDDNQPQWDWMRHRSSKDGGHVWSKETVLLKATAGSRDRQSFCDPG